MTTDLFKRTGMNPPARLRNTNADPFRFAAITLSVFGIHIEDTTLQSDTTFLKVFKISLSALSIVMANVFFLQHVVCYVHGLDSWVHTKWLTAALVSAVTSTLVIVKGTRIRHVAAFYRTNFLPWRSRPKTVAKTKSTATILVIWAFVLISCVDFATNGTAESEKIYSYFPGPPENGTFQPGSSPLAVGFLRLDALIRWFFILGPTCFSIFLYTFMTQLAAGNMDHLKGYIVTLKHSDHQDPAEVVRQVRDLYFHQASSAQDLDSIFSGLVLLWYLMCTVFTFANIRGAFLDQFPPTPFGKGLLTVLLEAFPLYCVYVGITMAAAGFHDATMDVLSQFEAFMAIVGKRYQLQFPTFFLAQMCVSSMGLNPPRLTVCRLFTIRRLLLALLVLFYAAFVTVTLRLVKAGDPV